MEYFLADKIEEWADKASNLLKRELVTNLASFVKNTEINKIAIVYGLKRTGKTTILKHLALEIFKDEVARKKTAVVIAFDGDFITDLDIFLKEHTDKGFRIFLISEFTNFIEYNVIADKLYNYYADLGIKFVLSGTHSLGMLALHHSDWLDRSILFKTPYIPFY